MAQRQNRTFSFDGHDDAFLTAIGRDQFSQPGLQYPSRDIFASPPEREAYPRPELPPSYPNLSSNPTLPQRTDSTDSDIPEPPSHRQPPSSYMQNVNSRNANIGYSLSNRTTSTATPGMDNLGETAAGGGIAGIAFGVANTNERASGVEALRSLEGSSRPFPRERDYDTAGTDTPYIPEPLFSKRSSPQKSPERNSYASITPLKAAPPSPEQLAPRPYSSNEPMLSGTYSRDNVSPGRTSYMDSPYKRYSTAWDPRMGQEDFDPNSIDDDGDDGLAEEDLKGRPALSFGKHSDHANASGAMAGSTGVGGVLGGLGGLIGRKVSGPRNSPNGQYGQIPGQGYDEPKTEKSEWLSRQTTGRRRMRWIVGILAAIIIIAAIVGGVVGGIKGNKSSGSTADGADESAAQDDSSGDLDKDSAEIKSLLGNPNLHRVFPGMDYTPFNAQYPACLTNPPSQNNVTRDMAVLSQLTNVVRLYGTDCNQTDMVLHAFNKLALTDMKLWLGVWLENNATTNDRQINAMYDLFDQNGAAPFAGVIIGNEVLFRKDLSEQQLGDILTSAKTNLTAKNINLPVATSDLGTDWTATLVSSVDIVMSNVHPFFGGVAVDQAASWTWTFWDSHDVVLTQGTNKQNVISEVGWPSAGGNNCVPGPCATGTAGSVAGIDEMNTFMGDFVCQSLANGTDYFWFEAFDEPWKVVLNTPGKDWEDKWGLMDAGRNLKPGLDIPDCGGKTVG